MIITTMSTIAEIQEQIQRDSDFATRQEFLRTKPWWLPAHDELLERLIKIIPDTILVAAPFSMIIECDMTQELTMIPGTIARLYTERMQPNQCHDNVLSLLESGKIEEGVFGVALSSDGLWREHSWGLKFNDANDMIDEIVETTELRLAYVALGAHSLE